MKVKLRQNQKEKICNDASEGKNGATVADCRKTRGKLSEKSADYKASKADVDSLKKLNPGVKNQTMVVLAAEATERLLNFAIPEQ